MQSFARGSPFRSLLMLVSVLALLVLAKIGPSNAVPPDEVAVSTDVVPVLQATVPMIAALDLQPALEQPAVPALAPASDRFVSSTALAPAVPTKVATVRRSPRAGLEVALNRTARPPSRLRS